MAAVQHRPWPQSHREAPRTLHGNDCQRPARVAQVATLKKDLSEGKTRNRNTCHYSKQVLSDVQLVETKFFSLACAAPGSIQAVHGPRIMIGTRYKRRCWAHQPTLRVSACLAHYSRGAGRSPHRKLCDLRSSLDELTLRQAASPKHAHCGCNDCPSSSASLATRFSSQHANKKHLDPPETHPVPPKPSPARTDNARAAHATRIRPTQHRTHASPL